MAEQQIGVTGKVGHQEGGQMPSAGESGNSVTISHSHQAVAAVRASLTRGSGGGLVRCFRLRCRRRG